MFRYLLAGLVAISLFALPAPAQACHGRGKRIAGAAKRVATAPVRLLKRLCGCGG